MKSRFLFSLLILMCFIGCGSDEEEIVGDPKIVKITCDGSTITVEFNKPLDSEVLVSYILNNPISWRESWVSTQIDNLIRIPYPKIDVEIRTFTIQWNTGNRSFPDPCR